MQFAKAMNIHSEWYAGLFLDISMLIWIENNLFTTVHGFYLYNHTKHQPKIDVFEYFRCVFSFVCFNTNRQNAPFHMKNQRKCTTVCCSSSCHLKVKRQFHLKSATELKCNYVVERRKTNARKQQWCRIKKCWLHSTVKFHILKKKKTPSIRVLVLCDVLFAATFLKNFDISTEVHNDYLIYDCNLYTLHMRKTFKHFISYFSNRKKRISLLWKF